MIENPAEWVERLYVCPSCHGRLEGIDKGGYRCGKEGFNFPVLFGIPDFRLPQRQDSAEIKRVQALIAQLGHLDYEGLVLFYLDSFGDKRAPDLCKKWTRRMIDTFSLEGERFTSICLQVQRAGMTLPQRGLALDLGCGVAGMSSVLAQLFGRCVGVDIALDLLILARKQIMPHIGGDIALVCASAESLPFRDNTFDFISCQDVIEHVAEPEKTLLESRRVLRSGGCLHLSCPQRYSLFFEPHVMLWGVGFLPRRWATSYVKLFKGIPYAGKRLPSFLELSRWLRRVFGTGFKVSALPDGALPASTSLGRLYRKLLALPLIKACLIDGPGRFVLGGLVAVCRK